MTTKRRRVAILYPAVDQQPFATSLQQSRHAATAEGLRAAGLEVIGTPYADDRVEAVRAQLLGVDGVLIWYNPIEGGRDRGVLNAMLRDVAATGVIVSTHPEVIDRIGTKEVLYRTRDLGWGADTRFYTSAEAMRVELAMSLAGGGPRVVKQIRGQSGDGVWKVELADPVSARLSAVPVTTPVRVRHAKRGSPEQRMTLESFVAQCQAYFSAGSGMIDQAYQPRLPEGMIRCYLVGGEVAGFGEQLVNMLVPPPAGASPDEVPLPGPRLYFPPTRPDFQRLKQKLEGEWIGGLCRAVGLGPSELPVLWDADFLYGPKDASGADTYVLCEINVSSVYPYPPSALAPLAAETRRRLQA